MVISALYNLLKNAVSNSRIGGMVALNSELVDGNWLVSVKDQGKGISQIDIDKLLENNYVSKENRDLSIVDQIARFHRGKLSVESELGRGSKFIFEIPVE
jgi:signal transduction histidine kinase